MNINHPDIRMLLALSDLFRRYYLPILIFICAFFFILTISNPAVFFNDEWITLNQLRQMDQGHQMIFNAGTYGVFKNGTSTPYFDVRDRYLGYTLMLPVLSWPILKVFSLFSDNFRLAVLFLWALLPILAVMLIARYQPEYSRLWGLPWVWIVFTIMTGLLLFNLVFYYPFPFIGDTVPREIAAVVFTQHILFAILAVVIFSIISLYSRNTWYSLFGLIICLGCSSYIFWAANGKDHLLTVTILAISLFFLIRYLLNGNYFDGISGFIAIGLLSWARPEFALGMFLISTAFFLLLNVYVYKKKYTNPFSFKFQNLLVPFATAFGALPFLFNNYYINKNPFSPPFLVYLPGDDGSIINPAIGANNYTIEIAQKSEIFNIFAPVVNKAISYLSISSPDFFGDLLSILINPQNGAISFLAISPISIIAVILFVYLIYCREKTQNTKIPLVFIFLLVLLFGLPITYIGNIEGLNYSTGVTPDIRYFSPIYLISSLLGIFLIYHFYSTYNWKKITIMTIGIISLGVPINLILLLQAFTDGGVAQDYIRFYNLFSILLTCIAALTLLLVLTKKKYTEYFFLFIGALTISPFSWQILFTYFFAAAKFNGYPFWVPMMEIIYNSVIFMY